MVVLASVEHVVGIDPDRDWVTASVVDTATTGEQATAVFETTQQGYGRLVKWADEHTQATDRAWSVEGAGGYGAGVTAFLTSRDECILSDRQQSLATLEGYEEEVVTPGSEPE